MLRGRWDRGRGTFAHNHVSDLGDGKTKLGELDEEFVYETRIGDTFMLGSQVWRVIDLTDDKGVVADAAGATPRMLFWRGDFPWRPYDLGSRVRAFRRTVAEQLERLCASLDLSSYRELFEFKKESAVLSYLDQLQQEYALDANSAWHVIDYVASQLDWKRMLKNLRRVEDAFIRFWRQIGCMGIHVAQKQKERIALVRQPINLWNGDIIQNSNFVP